LVVRQRLGFQGRSVASLAILARLALFAGRALGAFFTAFAGLALFASRAFGALFAAAFAAFLATFAAFARLTLFAGRTLGA
ncbi:hypothetical protein, partial [Bacillus licheniformis]|uniref:hypothetical protein n=1 Tax=Bacillus licheniformis TaxID=1402 RepID=UPI00232F28A3